MIESEQSIPPITNQVNPSPEDIQRFWSKVSKAGPDECWLWQAGKIRQGYGFFTFQRTRQLAHRVSWMICRGQIEDGICVLHRCDVPPCVNPNHLWLGTQSENIADMNSKGRQVSRSGDKSGPRLHPEKMARGSNNGSAILDEKSVSEIRSLYESSEASYSSLAKAFGVGRSTIFRIIKRTHWKHVA